MKVNNRNQIILGAVWAVILSAATAVAGLEFEHKLVETETDGTSGVVTVTYPFENTGDSSISIDKIKVSCGCMGARAEPEAVAPGDAGRIVATFNPAGRKGLQRKVIQVRTLEGKRKHKHLLALEVRILKQ